MPTAAIYERVNERTPDDVTLARSTHKWRVLKLALESKGFTPEQVLQIGEIVQPTIVQAAEGRAAREQVARMERALQHADIHCPTCDEQTPAIEAVLVKFGHKPYRCAPCAEASGGAALAEHVESIRSDDAIDAMREGGAS